MPVQRLDEVPDRHEARHLLLSLRQTRVMSIDRTGYVRPVGPVPSREQALLIALLAAGHPSLQAVDRKRPGFLTVHIDIPTGRVSWPIAPSDADLFEHVPFDNFATGDRLTRAERASRLEHTLPGAGDDDLLVAQHREAHHFGSPPRFDIRMLRYSA
jgi:hypothetical protein